MNDETETESKKAPPEPHERVIMRADIQDRVLRGYHKQRFEVKRGWAGNPTGKIIGEGTRTAAPRGQRLIDLLREGWIEPVENLAKTTRTKRGTGRP